MITAIPIEKGYPTYISINSQTRTAYLSYSSSNFILPVDIERLSIGHKIEAKFPENIAINPVSNMIYASSSEGIHVIDGSTNLVTALIEIGKVRSLGAVAVNPYTNTVYTTCFDSNVLTVIDGSSNQSVTEAIEVGKDPRGIGIDLASNRIFVANSGSNSISVVDGKVNKLVDTIDIHSGSAAVRKGPEFVVVNPITKHLYVQYCAILVAEGQAIFLISLLVMDTNKNTVRERNICSSMGGSPAAGIAFAYDKAKNVHYISKTSSNTVLKLDISGKKKLGTISLGKSVIWKRILSPFVYVTEPITVDSDANRLYVTESSRNILYEVDL